MKSTLASKKKSYIHCVANNCLAKLGTKSFAFPLLPKKRAQNFRGKTTVVTIRNVVNRRNFFMPQAGNI